MIDGIGELISFVFTRPNDISVRQKIRAAFHQKPQFESGGQLDKWNTGFFIWRIGRRGLHDPDAA